MIYTNVFNGDSNESLKRAQISVYGNAISKMFEVCWRQYVFAANLLQLTDAVGQRLKEITSFDHRILQDAHDIVAAYYRFEHGDNMQICLSEEPCSIEQYERLWIDWLNLELQALSMSPGFVRGVARAVVFQNTDLGYRAEEGVGRHLVARYGMREWARNEGLLKVYGSLERSSPDDQST